MLVLVLVLLLVLREEGREFVRIVNNSLRGLSDVVAKEQKRDPKSRLFI